MSHTQIRVLPGALAKFTHLSRHRVVAATERRYGAPIGRAARILLVLATFAVVFAPGQLQHLGDHEAPNASEMTAAMLAPTIDHDGRVAATRAPDLDTSLILAAVAIAAIVVLRATTGRRRPTGERRALPRRNASRLPAVRRGPPRLAA